MSIQLNCGAEISGAAKTRQPQTKLPRTAATEIKLLKVLQRRLSNVIAAALISGNNKATHGSEL